MTDTNKFIALILGDDDLNFGEEFQKFTEEEQASFIDLVADLSAMGFREIKLAPIDIQVMILTQALASQTPEMRRSMADVLGNPEAYGFQPSGSYSIEVVYTEETSVNWQASLDYNQIFIRSVIQYLDQFLKTRGYLFVNEIFAQLGLRATADGQVLGWCTESGKGAIDILIEWYPNGNAKLIITPDGNIVPYLDKISQGR